MFNSIEGSLLTEFCNSYKVLRPCISFYTPKNYTWQANLESIFQIWLAKFSFRECKARHVVSKPYMNVQFCYAYCDDNLRCYRTVCTVNTGVYPGWGCNTIGLESRTLNFCPMLMTRGKQYVVVLKDLSWEGKTFKRNLFKKNFT